MALQLFNVDFFVSFAKKIVLAGDPLQLGPVLRSKFAKQFGLELSLLERLINTVLYERNEDMFADHGSYDPLLVRTTNYGKYSKTLNVFLFLFPNKMLAFRAGIHKHLSEKQTVKTLIRLLLQKQSDLGLHCLSSLFGGAQWLSGRVFDLRPSLTGVTTLWSLSKTHLSQLSTGSTKEDLSLFN